MSQFILQESIQDLSFEDLPANWNTFDIKSFSSHKTLYDYQQKAVENAVKVLWQYYENQHDYIQKETLDVNRERKSNFFQWYKNNGLNKNLDFNLSPKIKELYVNDRKDYTDDFTIQNDKIKYEQFINRMSFWMATGSGKSLVLVKIIEILKELVKRKEIPNNDILILTHRDDLIEQLKTHVNEFNQSHPDFQILLADLKDYENQKLTNPSLFKQNEITVFYYRSDNLSTEQKEKLIDFKNYDNDGKWYVFLDEAHKGDREESIRQNIFSILTRNGFLFNFSATFTDPRDIITCAYEFNLASYIQKGYGKHLSLLQQEIRQFRRDEDFTDDEKQKIVLKSLIALTYTRKYYKKIPEKSQVSYHKPLMLTLVNSVNVQEADLKLFFRELERVGKKKIDDKTLKTAKSELWDEFKEKPPYLFEDDNKLEINANIVQSIGINDILREIFNSSKPGEIEVLIRSSNRKELAFRLKASGNPQPFALIKIGDISGWLKDELGGYDIQKGYEDETFFENLNKESSDINILMGSRSFYEGWDSNRPNVINFINIGTGTDARKFILQSIGRGVRIEPIKNKRRRLKNLYNENLVPEEVFQDLNEKIDSLETLFVFGTSRKALQTVLEKLKEQKPEAEKQLSLFKNEESIKGKTLLIPTYQEAEETEIKEDRKQKFELSKTDQRILTDYLNVIDDDRLLLVNFDTTPQKTQYIRHAINKKSSHFKEGEQDYKSTDIMVQRLFDFYDVIPQEFKELKEVEEEINHFRKIKVRLKDYKTLYHKIKYMKDYPDKVSEVKKKYGKVSEEKYSQMKKELEESKEFTDDHKTTKIEYIANHYYMPVLLTREEKIDYVSHIIKVTSEVDFIYNLIENNLDDEKFDWWLFSKIDASLDHIFIPYYNPKTNKISEFYPDFIFWLKKGKEFYVLFVDPKGTEHTSGLRKIDGYQQIFEENGTPKTFNYNGMNVKIYLQLKANDIADVPNQYRHYWFDTVNNIFSKIH